MKNLIVNFTYTFCFCAITVCVGILIHSYGPSAKEIEEQRTRQFLTGTTTGDTLHERGAISDIVKYHGNKYFEVQGDYGNFLVPIIDNSKIIEALRDQHLKDSKFNRELIDEIQRLTRMVEVLKGEINKNQYKEIKTLEELRVYIYSHANDLPNIDTMLIKNNKQK